MLKRLDLNSAQICELQSVLENEGDGRLLTENSVNLSIPIGFLGTRFLPLPAIDFHVRILGEERDWNVMLAQGNSGFVLLQQLRREGEQLFDGLSPVSAYPILHSQLSFATENRKSGWPCRVRSMLLEVVQWTLSHDKQVLGSPLWNALRDPLANPRIFAPHANKLRKVLNGKATVQTLWASWAEDEPSALSEFNKCLGMHSLLNTLLSRPTRRGP